MARRRGAGRFWRRLGMVLAVAVAVFVLASFYVGYRYAGRIEAAARVPRAEVALVFGAGLAPGKAPSPLLAERLDAAVALHRAGRVRKLLVSGDNVDRFHDETEAMRRYVLSRGVPETDLLADDAGLSTYDSCARAVEVFGVQSAVLVTQRFHLPRALFIANSLGLDAHGVAADEGRTPTSSYALREFFSRPLALAMVIGRPKPASPERPDR